MPPGSAQLTVKNALPCPTLGDHVCTQTRLSLTKSPFVNHCGHNHHGHTIKQLFVPAVYRTAGHTKNTGHNLFHIPNQLVSKNLPARSKCTCPGLDTNPQTERVANGNWGAFSTDSDYFLYASQERCQSGSLFLREAPELQESNL